MNCNLESSTCCIRNFSSNEKTKREKKERKKEKRVHEVIDMNSDVLKSYKVNMYMIPFICYHRQWRMLYCS